MLDIKTKAELRNINLRAQANGDEFVRAIDVKVMLLSVPLARVTTLLPDWEQFYKGENLALQELFPFKVHHKIDNVEFWTGEYSVKACTIKKDAEIWPKPGKVCDILATVQCAEFSDALLAHLSNNQRETIDVTLIENQADFLDQAV